MLIASTLRKSFAPLVLSPRRGWYGAHRVHRVLGLEHEELVLEAKLELHENGDRVFVDDQLVIELEHIPFRVPTTGRVVRGAVLARCPCGCRRRGRVLWVRPDDEEFFPLCRASAGIEYATARASEVERARLGYERVRRKLGVSRHGGHERRPHQRRLTHQRDCERLEAARDRLRQAEARELAYIMRRRRSHE